MEVQNHWKSLNFPKESHERYADLLFVVLCSIFNFSVAWKMVASRLVGTLLGNPSILTVGCHEEPCWTGTGWHMQSGCVLNIPCRGDCKCVCEFMCFYLCVNTFWWIIQSNGAPLQTPARFCVWQFLRIESEFMPDFDLLCHCASVRRVGKIVL